MSQVGNFVTIQNGTVKAYYDSWGALGSLYALSSGSQEVEGELASFESTDTLDGVFAEGGFLIDYDRKNLILFGFDYDAADTTYAEMHAACDAGIEAYLKFLAPRWQGWRLVFDYNGIMAFKAYLDENQTHQLKFLLSNYQEDEAPIVVQA